MLCLVSILFQCFPYIDLFENAHNSQNCDVKHKGYQGKPGSERKVPVLCPQRHPHLD